MCLYSKQVEQFPVKTPVMLSKKWTKFFALNTQHQKKCLYFSFKKYTVSRTVRMHWGKLFVDTNWLWELGRNKFAQVKSTIVHWIVLTHQEKCRSCDICGQSYALHNYQSEPHNLSPAGLVRHITNLGRCCKYPSHYCRYIKSLTHYSTTEICKQDSTTTFMFPSIRTFSLCFEPLWRIQVDLMRIRSPPFYIDVDPEKYSWKLIKYSISIS